MGLRIGGFAALGGVFGLVVATGAKAIVPDVEIRYGEWIGYASSLLGLFSFLVELFALLGLG